MKYMRKVTLVDAWQVPDDSGLEAAELEAKIAKAPIWVREAFEDGYLRVHEFIDHCFIAFHKGGVRYKRLKAGDYVVREPSGTIYDIEQHIFQNYFEEVDGYE